MQTKELLLALLQEAIFGAVGKIAATGSRASYNDPELDGAVVVPESEILAVSSEVSLPG